MGIGNIQNKGLSGGNVKPAAVAHAAPSSAATSPEPTDRFVMAGSGGDTAPKKKKLSPALKEKREQAVNYIKKNKPLLGLKILLEIAATPAGAKDFKTISRIVKTARELGDMQLAFETAEKYNKTVPKQYAYLVKNFTKITLHPDPAQPEKSGFVTGFTTGYPLIAKDKKTAFSNAQKMFTEGPVTLPLTLVLPKIQDNKQTSPEDERYCFNDACGRAIQGEENHVTVWLDAVRNEGEFLPWVDFVDGMMIGALGSSITFLRNGNDAAEKKASDKTRAEEPPTTPADGEKIGE